MSLSTVEAQNHERIMRFVVLITSMKHPNREKIYQRSNQQHHGFSPHIACELISNEIQIVYQETIVT